ncbi:MAG: TonB-dependent receptor [Stagnimonas sp.]|nr:TonB-dependent receptor [Stagnimonas sp.]
MLFVRSAVSLAVAAFCLPVLADDAAPTALLEPVQVTATRTAESTFDVPQPVTVVGREEIANRTPQVLAEALRGEAGVFFQQTAPGQGMVIVRGLKGSEVLHLVDGFRLNNAFFRTAPSQYVALIDPWNVEQLEVLRGPYATYYGSDAMGGVVQITTPEERFASDAPQYRTRALLHYQSADLTKVGRLSHAIGNKHLSVAGGITTADYGNRLVGGAGQIADGRGNISFGDRVGPTDYTARSYDFKTLWTPNAAHELMLQVQYFNTPSGIPRYSTELVPGFNPISGTNPSRADAQYYNAREFYQLRYRATAPIAFLDTFEAQLGRQVIDDDRFDLQRNLTRRETEKSRSTLDGLTLAASTGLGAVTLKYGAELYRDEVESRRVRQDGTGAPVVNSPTTAFKSRYPNGASTDNLGAYLGAEWALSPRVRVDLGGRINDTKTKLPAAPESDRPIGGTLNNTDYSAQAGLRVALTPTLAWVSNAGRGYRAPNIFDLAATGDRAQNRVVVANPDLKPESLVSVDTGFKFGNRKAQAELVGFYSRYRDRITLINPAVANGEQGCTEAAGCAQNRNITKATYYGVESGGQLALASNLSLKASVNYTWGEQKNNGSTQPGNRVPPLNASLAMRWQPLPTVEVEPSIWANGTQDRLDDTDLADNRIAKDGTAGFGVVNLRAGWTPNDTYRVQLFGENLLDKSYREHGSGIDGRGRGVGITLSADFK